MQCNPIQQKPLPFDSGRKPRMMGPIHRFLMVCRDRRMGDFCGPNTS